MRLEAIEESRIAVLMNLTRPEGQLFVPIAVAALMDRYSFQVAPDGNELLGEVLPFRHGVFDGNAFDLSIYPDGAILKSASNTDFLDAVLNDVLSWAKVELGLVPTSTKPQTFYDSDLVVSMEIPTRTKLMDQIAGQLKSHQAAYGLEGFDFELYGVTVAVDQTAHAGRRPSSFTLARRANIPFGSNIYFSSAPLKTADHLSLLKSIEAQMIG